jgi:phenylpyruvate tautomerase PptA (4-oxalocrotonate tautomerase family)
MPFVEVFTREKLSDEVRTRLAEDLSNTVMTVEVGGPTESAKMIDWMWFYTMPADRWAVGGRFDDTYVNGRKMALARIIAPQGLMNAELKSRAVKEVARVLKTALGLSREEDDTGIFTMLVEIDDGQWATGAEIPTLFQLLDNLGGNVSEQRRAEMSARYPRSAETAQNATKSLRERLSGKIA